MEGSKSLFASLLFRPRQCCPPKFSCIVADAWTSQGKHFSEATEFCLLHLVLGGLRHSWCRAFLKLELHQVGFLHAQASVDDGFDRNFCHPAYCNKSQCQQKIQTPAVSSPLEAACYSFVGQSQMLMQCSAASWSSTLTPAPHCNS